MTNIVVFCVSYICFFAGKVAVPFAGVLPFGAVLVELVFVMNALWEQQLYYIFGFLLSVMIILTVTCAEISIVMCYFQLCSEDYRWYVCCRLHPYRKVTCHHSVFHSC